MRTIISAECRGGCGTALHYTLKISKLDAPELEPPSSRIAYGAGHLCHECQRVVEAALGQRRLDVARNEANKRRQRIPVIGGGS